MKEGRECLTFRMDLSSASAAMKLFYIRRMRDALNSLFCAQTERKFFLGTLIIVKVNSIGGVYNDERQKRGNEVIGIAAKEVFLWNGWNG